MASSTILIHEEASGYSLHCRLDVVTFECRLEDQAPVVGPASMLDMHRACVVESRSHQLIKIRIYAMRDAFISLGIISLCGFSF